MFGDLNEQEIDALMESQLVGRLGCTAEGMIYVVPLSYVYDKKGIYVHSREGMKIDLMKKNPSVCFQVDDTRDLSNWQSAICWGTFEEIKNEDEIQYVVKLLRSRIMPAIKSATMQLSKEWPFDSDNDGKIDGTFFRIVVSKKTGRFEKMEDSQYYAS